MKKLLSWILVLALCLSLFPGMALAEDAEEPVGEIAPVEEPVPSLEEDDGGLSGTPAPTEEDEAGALAGDGVLDVPSDEPAVLLTDPAADEIQDVTASGTCGENLTWTLENGVLTISGTGAMSIWNSESDVPWYSQRESISQIVFPEGLTSIGQYAFRGCKYVASVTIPEGVTSIGGYAFRECSSLVSVTIPDSVTSVGSSAFSGCSSLASVTIPEGVTSIGDSAFSGCSSLTSVTIPEGVTSIGSYAFRYCSSLKTICFLGDAPTISSNAFSSVRGTALYPVDNETWTASLRKSYGGSLTWVGYRGQAKAYTIHFDPNGGSNAPADQIKGYGVDVTLSNNQPALSNKSSSYTVSLDPNGGEGEVTDRNGSYTISYSFVNWNTAQDGSGTAYSPGATYSQDEDLTLYAQWTENVGTGSVILPQIDREGHRLLGWARDPAAAEAEFAPNSYYNGNEDITLYAVWAPYTFPVVYIVGKGAQGPENQVKTWGVDLTLSDMVPTAEGYDFIGWSLYNQSNIPDYQPGDVYTGNGSGPDGSEIRFYAIWQLKIYLVTYKANGGEDAPAAQLKTHGRSLTLSEEAPYREGYRFLGWSTNKWSTEAEYQPGDSFTANRDTTLYALWEKKYPEVPTGSVLALTDAQSAAGYDFTVDLTLDENPGVMMISFKLDYDKDALEFLGGEDGALKGWYFSDTGAIWDNSSDRTETGCLAKLNFRVKDGADTGRTEIYITDLFTGNFNEEALIVDPVSSTVNIVQRVGGDVNSDGSVNGFDLLRLRKHLAGLDVEYSLVNSDVNRDGVVDLLDLVRLRKYLAGVNVDLG